MDKVSFQDAFLDVEEISIDVFLDDDLIGGPGFVDCIKYGGAPVNLVYDEMDSSDFFSIDCSILSCA